MTQQPATKRRWYGHPFVIGLLVLLLFADLLSMPSVPWKESTVQRAVLGAWRWRGSAHGRPVPGEAYRTEAGFVWRWTTDPYDYSSFDLLTGDNGQWAGVFRDMMRYDGFYHLTRRTEQFFVYPDELSAEDQQAVLDAILVAIEREPDYEQLLRFVPDMIRAGVRARTFPIYWGYARNTLAAFVALAFIIGCTRGRPWEWFREPRLGFDGRYSQRARRQRRGECGSCGYDLVGLTTGRCPECGSGTDGSTEPSEHTN